ncbi:hypothetical protein [Nocardioides sp. B-3]|uniref:hypothetical protein n=1 Tax=Nocardioides sp. B-3 TaxID=2895565 RepID=UPI0021530334|nr:hypothetical protein [Nocardioides sp. B-3]UUZ57833.1 hypothetical protein LP418_15680 [Nocardioides sp. B-3]
MDLDAYVLAQRSQWVRLEELTSQRRLDGAETDELVDLYQRVATHLSVVRTSAPDAALIAYLSSIPARARLRTVGTRATTWRGVGAFFTDRFPAALYRLRWWWLGTPGGQRRGHRRDDLVAAPAPGGGAEPDVPRRRSTSSSGTTSRTTTANTRRRTSPPVCGSTTPGSRPSASHSACSVRRSSTCCSTTSPTSRSSPRS